MRAATNGLSALPVKMSLLNSDPKKNLTRLERISENKPMVNVQSKPLKIGRWTLLGSRLNDAEMRPAAVIAARKARLPATGGRPKERISISAGDTFGINGRKSIHEARRINSADGIPEITPVSKP